MEDDEEEDDNIPDWTQEGAVADDLMGETQGATFADDPLDNLGEMILSTIQESKKFERMLEDHKKQLYSGCKQGHKKLGSTLEML